MLTTLAPRSPVRPLLPLKQGIVLTASFWLFSYTFLALRKFLSTDDLSVAISVQRLIAISAGAFAYWLVVRQIESGAHIRLRTVIGWVAVATLAMIRVRVGLSNLLADDPVPLARSLRWTLTWSAYFSLWVVGAVAYLAPAAAPGRAAPVPLESAIPAPAAAATSRTAPAPAHVDELSQLIEAIALEAAAELSAADRKALAARVLRFGRYEVVGDDAWSKSLAVRSSFAWRLAIRLSRDY